MPIFIFFIILSILVLIHEMGHFLVAKKNNVYVEEFGFGLPPRLFGVKIGETLYSINLLPFGGFVKVLGEEEAELAGKKLGPALAARTFVSKAPPIKLAILTAGVFMNAVLAIVIFYSLLSANNFLSEPVMLLGDHSFRFGKQIPVSIITGVEKDKPAAKTDIREGDVIKKLSADKKTTVTDPSVDEMMQFVNNTKAVPIYIETENIYNGEKKAMTITPSYDETHKRHIIGVGLTSGAVLDYSASKAFSGVAHSYNMTNYNMAVIGKLFGISVKERRVEPVSQSVSGPVGILSIVSQMVEKSGPKLMTNILNLTALLSLSLAFMNIVPFPALDGGRAAVVAYEWVRGRKINATLERRLNVFGFAILLSLLVLISINDILNHFR